VRSWDAVSGQPILPCTDPAPAKGDGTALSPDGARRVVVVGFDLCVLDPKDTRPWSDLVFLKQLNDQPARLRWHREEADASEKVGQWFAAAFHLRQLIAGKEPDADRLRERLKGCEDRLKQP
jgi:hypothetical protein